MGENTDVVTAVWKPIPGWPYEAANVPVRDENRPDLGVIFQIRSTDRIVKGRPYAGALLKPKASNRPECGDCTAARKQGRPQRCVHGPKYLQVNLRRENPADPAGPTEMQTFFVHALVLWAHAGERPPGAITRHLNDIPDDNRWAPGDIDDEVRAAGGNIVYGDQPTNEGDKDRLADRRRREHAAAEWLTAYLGRVSRVALDDVLADATAAGVGREDLYAVRERCGVRMEMTPFWVTDCDRQWARQADVTERDQAPPTQMSHSVTGRGWLSRVFGRGEPRLRRCTTARVSSSGTKGTSGTSVVTRGDGEWGHGE